MNNEKDKKRLNNNLCVSMNPAIMGSKYPLLLLLLTEGIGRVWDFLPSPAGHSATYFFLFVICNIYIYFSYPSFLTINVFFLLLPFSVIFAYPLENFCFFRWLLIIFLINALAVQAYHIFEESENIIFIESVKSDSCYL